jgi:hypothetical protein
VRKTGSKSHLRIIGAQRPEQPPAEQNPASSIITIEIDRTGRLRRLDVNLRKEDAAQALHGLAMANLRALDLLAS